ncbi:hypothetical protein GCM10022630_02670 [Thermobifida alba]
MPSSVENVTAPRGSRVAFAESRAPITVEKRTATSVRLPLPWKGLARVERSTDVPHVPYGSKQPKEVVPWRARRVRGSVPGRSG